RLLRRHHGLAPGGERAIVLRQQPGGSLADLRDSQGIDEAFEGDAAARLDGAQQLGRRLLAPALAFFQFGGALAEAEDVGGRFQPAFLPQLFDALLAETVDIEGVAADEMLEALDRLGRADEAAGAAAHDHALLADGVAVADRAAVGEGERLAAARALLRHHRDHLRDDVAGALDDDMIALADVLAGDLVLVVQGGAADDDAADGDWLQLGHRGQRAGAADLDRDRAQDRLRLLGRELVGERPARRAAHHAEPRL